MDSKKRLTFSLFLSRITVFIVMFMWTVDKFLYPAHSAQVFEKFYFIPSIDALTTYIIGGIELIIILCFLAGFKKTWTYGAVLLFHTISTLSAYRQYVDPFTGVNLLFFAAWPMLAACITLFLLRKEDSLLSIE